MKRGLWIAGLFAVLSSGCDANFRQSLSGTGSSFVQPMMASWADEYQKTKGIKVNYEAVGSLTGLQRLSPGIFDFACTDVPLTKEQLEKLQQRAGEVVQIPIVLGAVVPAYHLAGLKEPLVFSGPVLAGIYLGKIKKWNDPALQALNSGVALPDQEINVIHRSDGSGTTYTWTEYLAKVSAEWKQVGTSITWPVGAGEPGNDAVTRRVKSTPWSIGYIPLPYALKEEVPFGLVQNAEGVPVKASVESVTAAAKAILPKIGEELAFSLANAPGKDSYPIGGATWAVVCAKQSGARGKALAEFFRWVIHEGQDKAEALHYSRLPSELVERVDRKLGAVAAP